MKNKEVKICPHKNIVRKEERKKNLKADKVKIQRFYIPKIVEVFYKNCFSYSSVPSYENSFCTMGNRLDTGRFNPCL